VSGPALLFKLPANEPADAGSVVAIVVNLGGAEVALKNVIWHSGWMLLLLLLQLLAALRVSNRRKEHVCPALEVNLLTKGSTREHENCGFP